MSQTDDIWTLAHDLALIYIALAYGTDCRLSNAELEVITKRLQGWREEFAREEVQEVVLEAMAIFLEGQAGKEVVRSMQSLKEALSREELRRVLEDIVRIAEADGVLLSNERGLISTLAEVWNLKATEQNLLTNLGAGTQEHPSWSLLHDIGLIYLVLAHSTDNELSKEEIDATLARLGDWQPELEEEAVREVLREALQFYATGPDEPALRKSVQVLRDALPMVQRLALLDDLFFIAEADGTFRQEEKEMIQSLAQAWNVSVRLNGQWGAER